MIKDCHRGRITLNFPQPLAAHQSNFCLNPHSTKQSNGEAGLVFTVSEFTLECLRDRIGFVTVNPKFQRNVMSVSDHKLVRCLDTLEISLVSGSNLLRDAFKNGIKDKLRRDEMRIPVSQVLPALHRRDMDIRRNLRPRRSPAFSYKTPEICRPPLIDPGCPG